MADSAPKGRWQYLPVQCPLKALELGAAVASGATMIRPKIFHPSLSKRVVFFLCACERLSD